MATNTKGIPQIRIPVRVADLTIESVELYLDTIFQTFQDNAKKIRNDYNVYLLDHKILKKVRAHDDTDVNNIVLIPDLNTAISWKTGYVFGNPIKYAQSKSNDTNDIEYLNKYVRNACQRSVDKEVGKWAYATGVGYYFIEPKSVDYDIETEAPYELYCREADTCTKVYSSYGGYKPLFDMLYTQYDKLKKDGMTETVDVLDIYLPDYLYTYEKDVNKGWIQTNKQARGLFKGLPLVEKRYNADGIGMVAKAELLQNAIDQLLSNGMDNVEDIVNEVYVYYNVNLGDTAEEQAKNHKQMKKNGAVVLNGSKDLQPKLDTISTKLSLSEVKELFGILNEEFHSTLGVPMAMSNTNSGGTTKSGSEVANGYDNAYNIALDDINTFLKADTELLEKIMWICKNAVGNQINKLAPSEVEIKYSLNLTDNMLIKSQSYGTFIQTMPPSMALRMCRLSNDPEAEGKLIEECTSYQNFIADKSKEVIETEKEPKKETNE